MGASQKVNVGGMGAGSGAGGGGSTYDGDRGHDTTYGGADGEADGTSVDSDLKIKRSIGLAFLAAGVIAIGYVIAKARNVKKVADGQGDMPES
jgi:hypothetical protein